MHLGPSLGNYLFISEYCLSELYIFESMFRTDWENPDELRRANIFTWTVHIISFTVKIIFYNNFIRAFRNL